MSHDIENNELAFVGAPPWHGLGVPVRPGATPLEMLKAAHLDWQVICRPAFAILKDQPLATRYQAVVRADTGRCFGMAGKEFSPVQNCETVDFFKAFCDTGDLLLETVGAVRGGDYVWALARINDAQIEIGGDTLKTYLLIANSHCPRHALTIKTTMIRVVCNNTLTFALNEKARTFGRFVHDRHIHDRIGHAKAYVKEALETQRKFAMQMAALVKTPVDDATARRLLAKTLDIEPQGKKMAQLLHLFHGGQQGSDLTTVNNNAWALLNAVTEHLDHQVGRDMSTRLHSSWFGRGEKLKQRMLKQLTELAEAD
jgi:phage/plasmid-like protein (TIGR03299 family)